MDDLPPVRGATYAHVEKGFQTPVFHDGPRGNHRRNDRAQPSHILFES